MAPPRFQYQTQMEFLVLYPTPSSNCLGREVHVNTEPSLRTLDSREVPLPMQPLKTYIVEDSLVIRENLIATLEELGPVEVVGTAEDESTAVQWLERPSNHFDLVIVDIFLKGGSGLGVLRASHGLRQRHKMVVLSNYATPDIRRKCLELGADRVFDKSNDIDALIAYCTQLAAGNSGPAALN
jgi:DNA-binding NarL/FixJ family response regulator